MISIFGVVSILIFLASVGALFLHSRVMKMRVEVDDALLALESLTHEQAEAEKITQATEDLNNKIAAYNEYISHGVMRVMAMVLGFSAEKRR